VQDEAVNAARKSVDLTTSQYKAGTVSYLNVITVQTIALTDEVTAIQIRGRRIGRRGPARPGARRGLDRGRASVASGCDEEEPMIREALRQEPHPEPDPLVGGPDGRKMLLTGRARPGRLHLQRIGPLDAFAMTGAHAAVSTRPVPCRTSCAARHSAQ